ncbi:MAG: methylated-DNA--[protein]-cysteine S-methyltransferase [Vicinamibacterales bacterium]
MPTHAEHTTYYTYIDTPVGKLMLAGCDDHGLRYIAFQCGKGALAPKPEWKQSAAPFRAVERQLREYFQGKRTEFDLPLHPKGTPFQQSVWKALLKIPYGKTRSYGDIAKAIGRPTAVRAVGLANGRNPLPIVVPCHRVIGASGKLVGYGGGLHVKQALLDREREVSAARRTRAARRQSSS